MQCASHFSQASEAFHHKDYEYLENFFGVHDRQIYLGGDKFFSPPPQPVHMKIQIVDKTG